MSFCRSGARAAWELLGARESLYGGCQGRAARYGKLRQIISAPEGGYSSAKLVLAAELFSATLCRSTTMFAEPLPKGGSVMGGHRGAGKPLGEILKALREPIPQVDVFH